MTKVRCDRTGIEMDPSDGIWDDGEWLSWEWINSQMEEEPVDEWIDPEDDQGQGFAAAEASRAGFPFRLLEHTEIFNELVELARRYRENSGRYLQIWGELGEMYAEIRHGLRRHGSLHPGSDGTIDGALVEVKTISPEKSSDRVIVKRGGDFQKLLIVKIDSEFGFQAKLFDRSELREGTGPHYRARFAVPSED